MSAPLRSYSAGMRMRLAFAVTTALPGDVILMDEWLSVGDFDFSQKATARLLEIVHGSAILVIASHHRSLLTHLCTKIISLDQGRIVDVEKAPFD